MSPEQRIAILLHERAILVTALEQIAKQWHDTGCQTNDSDDITECECHVRMACVALEEVGER